MFLYTKNIKKKKNSAELPIDITTQGLTNSVCGPRDGCPAAAAKRGKQPPAAAGQMERAPAASAASQQWVSTIAQLGTHTHTPAQHK